MRLARRSGFRQDRRAGLRSTSVKNAARFSIAIAFFGFALFCLHSLSANEPNTFIGHTDNVDQPYVRSVYPFLSGSVLDNCVLCHRGGTVKEKLLNGCDYCHQTHETQGFNQTLNAYGIAFLQAGRTEDAIRKIETQDSDQDGYSNLDELKAMTNPGEAESRPQFPEAPNKILDQAALAKVPTHEQFLLINSANSKDAYALFSGYNVLDLITAAGVDSKSFTSVTIIAADGYRKDFTRDEVLMKYPASTYYAAENFTKDPACPSWIDYPHQLPPGIQDGNPIPGKFRLMIASASNGVQLKPATRSENGTLSGEGPYRLILPQRTASAPDQNHKINNPECPFPYDPAIHHNSGDCVRSVVALQVHPMPQNTREPDWAGRLDEFLTARKLMVFGCLKESL